jgi:hypothetical protein
LSLARNVLRLALARADEHDLAAGDHDEAHLPRRLRAVEDRDRGVADREEVAIPLVHEVGHPAAVALSRQGERALDPVTDRLDHDGLAAHVHGRGSYPARGTVALPGRKDPRV